MFAVIEGMEREGLLQEISKALHQWPELERTVFSQAHYNGKSVEAISRSLQLDREQVSGILKQCERRLHDSLIDFRKSHCGRLSLLSPDKSRTAA